MNQSEDKDRATGRTTRLLIKYARVMTRYPSSFVIPYDHVSENTSTWKMCDSLQRLFKDIFDLDTRIRKTSKFSQKISTWEIALVKEKNDTRKEAFYKNHKRNICFAVIHTALNRNRPVPMYPGDYYVEKILDIVEWFHLPCEHVEKSGFLFGRKVDTICIPPINKDNNE